MSEEGRPFLRHLHPREGEDRTPRHALRVPRPSGATGCSHGWGDAALSVAEPVEDVTESRAAPAGAEEELERAAG
jgi:hypothetical protein